MNSDCFGNRINRPDQLRYEGNGDDAGGHVENQMPCSQALTLVVGTHRAENGGNSRADVGADSKRQGIFIGHLLGGERSDDQHQGGMRRLHDHGGEDADTGKGEQAQIAVQRELGHVNAGAEGLETFLHVVDAEEQETEAGENIAGALNVAVLLEHQNNAEHPASAWRRRKS